MYACPLCNSNSNFYHQDNRRRYFNCTYCDLVFVEPTMLPSAREEKAEYDLHQNAFDDQGYIQFLNRMVIPIEQYIDKPSEGLDFGCGPNAVLASLLENRGYTMTTYDPYYANHKNVLSAEREYNFIVCTEAIEHFHQPKREWELWQTLLKPKGWIAIMTKRVINKDRFASWHYKNDQTHVSFFSDNTFKYLAEKYHFSLKLVSSDIVLLHKQ